MAIKVNGKLVAGGKGTDGKSAYQYAQDGGYTGTEDDFQALMGTGPWLPLSGGDISGNFGVQGDTFTLNKDIKIKATDFAVTTEGAGLPPLLDISSKYNEYKRKTYLEIGLHPPGTTSIENSFDVQTILSGIATPKMYNHAANKKYVDDSIASAIDDSWSSEY